MEDIPANGVVCGSHFGQAWHWVFPLELLFGQQAVLPVDLEAVTYLAMDWGKVKSTADLLEARAEKLVRR